MEIFSVDYNAGWKQVSEDIVICNNENEIPIILAKRHKKSDTSGIKITEIRKENIESIRVSQLTAGDLLRLINNRGDYNGIL